MPYSDEEMREIACDPVRLRGYYWKVAMNARRMAAQKRAASRAAGCRLPVTHYKLAFVEGQDIIAEAGHLERFSAMILEHMDALVNSTIEPRAHGQQAREEQK